MQRERCGVVGHDRHVRSGDDADGPAQQQRLGIEPAGVQSDHERGERLENPRAAEELESDRVLGLRKTTKSSATRQITSVRIFAVAVSPESRLDENCAEDVASEQVRAADRHDRRRNQRADHDRRIGDADEPIREDLSEEHRHDQLRVRHFDTGRDTRVSQQREEPEQQRVDRQEAPCSAGRPVCSWLRAAT